MNKRIDLMEEDIKMTEEFIRSYVDNQKYCAEFEADNKELLEELKMDTDWLFVDDYTLECVPEKLQWYMGTYFKAKNDSTILEAGVSRLKGEMQIVAKEMFLNGRSAGEVATIINKSRATVFRRRQEAVSRIAEYLVILFRYRSKEVQEEN